MGVWVGPVARIRLNRKLKRLGAAVTLCGRPVTRSSNSASNWALLTGAQTRTRTDENSILFWGFYAGMPAVMVLSYLGGAYLVTCLLHKTLSTTLRMMLRSLCSCTATLLA